jgi:hypothetical protein
MKVTRAHAPCHSHLANAAVQIGPGAIAFDAHMLAYKLLASLKNLEEQTW